MSRSKPLRVIPVRIRVEDLRRYPQSCRQAKKIGGAYLDVFEVEPLPPDSGFWDLPNVLVISHSAAASDGHGRRVANAFAKNLARWAEGKPLLNVAEA